MYICLFVFLLDVVFEVECILKLYVSKHTWHKHANIIHCISTTFSSDNLCIKFCPWSIICLVVTFTKWRGTSVGMEVIVPAILPYHMPHMTYCSIPLAITTPRLTTLKFVDFGINWIYSKATFVLIPDQRCMTNSLIHSVIKSLPNGTLKLLKHKRSPASSTCLSKH